MKNYLKFLVLAIISFSLSAASQTPTASTPATLKADVVLTKDNSLNMDTIFMPDTVANLSTRAREMDARLPSGEPIYLVLDSGGGSIDAGIELIENLKNLNRPVHTVSLFAASMAFQTVQGLGTRYVVENGTLMSHRAKGGFFGEFPGQLDSRYGYYLRRVERLDQKAAGRTNGKYNLQTYRNLIQNEYWCDGKDCVDQGFADKVATVACDKSLDGTRNVLVDRFAYMGHIVEIVLVKAACPTITGALDFKIYIDGKPLFSEDADTLVTSGKKKLEPAKRDQYGYLIQDKQVNAFDGLSVETIENIKKLVEQKVNAVNERKVVAY